MIYEQKIENLTLIEPLLADAGLGKIERTDYTIGLFDDGRLVGTGSLKDGIVMGIAVDRSIRGDGMTNRVITALIEEAMRREAGTLYLFTKPDKAPVFSSMGFRELVSAPPYAVMMEWGKDGLGDYLTNLTNLTKLTNLASPARGAGGPAAAIVMNANPFTKGHLFLAEKAAAENDTVYIFAVEEDRSVFPYQVRRRLIEQGVSHLRNVMVMPGGRYVVSSLTFPSYFTKREDLAAAHAALDAELFGSRIAPALQIKKRYVGTEPHSVVTDIYNQELKKRLPSCDIEVMEVPRKEIPAGVVSATTVRSLIREGKLGQTEAYLPAATFSFLESAEAEPIIRQIREGAGK